MRTDSKLFGSRSPQNGFTLIEIIIVVAIIALIGGLVVVNLDGMLRGLGDRSIDLVFKQAVQEGRYQAGLNKELTSLSFDPENRAFIISGISGNQLESFSYSKSSDSELVNVSFFQILPEMGMSRNLNNERSPIDAIYFQPDRASTPFIVAFQIDANSWEQQYDPFSLIILSDSRNK